MKKLRSFVLLGVTALLFSSCATLTPGQQRAADIALSITKTVAMIAVQSVLDKALSGSDFQIKADYLNSAALGLRTIQDRSGDPANKAVVGDTILQFTNEDKPHWNLLANKVATQIATSGLPVDVALEAAAVGLNKAATLKK